MTTATTTLAGAWVGDPIVVADTIEIGFTASGSGLR
jgi:hypothetical protein